MYHWLNTKIAPLQSLVGIMNANDIGGIRPTSVSAIDPILAFHGGTNTLKNILGF